MNPLLKFPHALLLAASALNAPGPQNPPTSISWLLIFMAMVPLLLIPIFATRLFNDYKMHRSVEESWAFLSMNVVVFAMLRTGVSATVLELSTVLTLLFGWPISYGIGLISSMLISYKRGVPFSAKSIFTMTATHAGVLVLMLAIFILL